MSPRRELVYKMADLFSGFSKTVSTLSAQRSSSPAPSSRGGFFGSSNQVRVEKPSMWDRFWGASASDAVVKHDSSKPTPDVPRVISVSDGNASAGQQLTPGGTPTDYYRTSTGGGKTFLKKIDIKSALSVFRDS